jgi:hypothetical protein
MDTRSLARTSPRKSSVPHRGPSGSGSSGDRNSEGSARSSWSRRVSAVRSTADLGLRTTSGRSWPIPDQLQLQSRRADLRTEAPARGRSGRWAGLGRWILPGWDTVRSIPLARNSRLLCASPLPPRVGEGSDPQIPLRAGMKICSMLAWICPAVASMVAAFRTLRAVARAGLCSSSACRISARI